MSYSADELKSFNTAATNNRQFVSSVSGRKASKQKKFSKIKSFSASMFLIIMGLVIFVLFGSGNIIPSAISERLIEETDMQYADAVESKMLVFQQAMKEGNLPSSTIELLKTEKVEVVENGGELALKMGDKIITADEFVTAAHSDIKLYQAFEVATYGRAEGWFDEPAQKYFREIGTSRDNYTSQTSFESVMDGKVGVGSDINVNTVALVEKKRVNEETGEEETYQEYEEIGERANSGSAASEFINAVREKNPAESATDSALFTANALNVADTIAKEERSGLFFITFMENISKMKAGEGNESQINEAMNYLYENAESEILDVRTGEIVKSSGTPLESPSLYAVLSGTKIKAEEVANYSSDRILKTIENQTGGSGTKAIAETVTSTARKKRGSIGRFIESALAVAEQALMEIVAPTVSASLVDNSFATVKGINAGEFLVEGAINIGGGLAKASGATGGDAAAAVSYARLNNTILAMDAQVDRMNKSPFDITSKNTFLGSIVYNFAVFSRQAGSVLTRFSNLIKTTATAILPRVYADGVNGYLTTFGDCETYGSIGVVGSAQCAEVATFDASTLNNPFSDPGFMAFVEANTVLDANGNRSVVDGSALSNFIIYNNERKTPLGVMDGGILEALAGERAGKIPFISDILKMILTFLEAPEEHKRIASGAAFVNSSANPDWQTYKYAQRYVSLARATAALRSHADDANAYNNIKFFEGQENPVMAFIKEYYASK